jgi:hypothetical protein
MEPCGTPTCISRGMDSLPLTIILNFLLERNDLIRLTNLDDKCNLDTLEQARVPWSVKSFFDIQEYYNHRHTIIEV